MRWPQLSFAVCVEGTSSEPQAKHSTSRGGGGAEEVELRRISEPNIEDSRACDLREGFEALPGSRLSSEMVASLTGVVAARGRDDRELLDLDLRGAGLIPTCDMLSSGVTSSSGRVDVLRVLPELCRFDLRDASELRLEISGV